ncbi:hypothetical protein I547_7765 [Mycobacterium kansasii 824]|nr:hypothetical protein I547_7765 [Mycobacterium kansasii 824]
MRTGIRLMIAGDYDQLSQLRENDLRKPARAPTAPTSSMPPSAISQCSPARHVGARPVTRHVPRRRSRNSSMPASRPFRR